MTIVSCTAVLFTAPLFGVVHDPLVQLIRFPPRLWAHFLDKCNLLIPFACPPNLDMAFNSLLSTHNF
jgi:hypothetical protein